jgi:hypothetical protein
MGRHLERSCTIATDLRGTAGLRQGAAGVVRASLVGLLSAQTLSCTPETSLGPPAANMTGPVTTGSNSSDDDGSGSEGETGAPSDTSMACDPLADPVLECGRGMACDLTSGDCVAAVGEQQAGDPCVATDECVAGLICATGRCQALCDVAVTDACAGDRVCIAATPPIPGLCAENCDLILDACSVPGDACKRAVGMGGVLQAACVGNPGVGLTGDPCLDDSDCAAAHLCTDTAVHTLPCIDGASRCCAPVCDPIELPCFGLEPLCYPLDIPGQESAGFCGAE